MKRSIRRLVSIAFSLLLLLTTFSNDISAKSFSNYEVLQSELDGYEYIKYNKPIEENHNGRKRLLLGYLKPNDINTEIMSLKTEGISPADYREYDTYKVYDYGIIKHWSWLSNDYFLMSIARGMEYSETYTLTKTIAASYSGTFPSEAKSAINSEFGIKASGSKTVSQTIKLSGPSYPYNSRDFYYNHGRHTHEVLVVQEHRSNWDGILWTKNYWIEVGVPAIKHFSKDTM